MITNKQKNITEITNWFLLVWGKQENAQIPGLHIQNHFQHLLGSMISDLHTVFGSKGYQISNTNTCFDCAKLLHENHDWKPKNGLGSWLQLGVMVAQERAQADKISNRHKNWAGFNRELSILIKDRIFSKSKLLSEHKDRDIMDRSSLEFLQLNLYPRNFDYASLERLIDNLTSHGQHIH